MKLKVSYDLIDKIKEADTGFSLKKTAKKVGTLTAVSTALCYGIDLAIGAQPTSYIMSPLIVASIHSSCRVLEQMMLGKFYQAQAQVDIIKLLNQLENINVQTNYADLLQATTYKTEYKPDFESRVIEQKKYIHVPVNDYWGEREMSLCQEHIVGSKEWVLSVGLPEEKNSPKVLTLAKNAINK